MIQIMLPKPTTQMVIHKSATPEDIKFDITLNTLDHFRAKLYAIKLINKEVIMDNDEFNSLVKCIKYLSNKKILRHSENIFLTKKLISYIETKKDLVENYEFIYY